MPGPDNKVRARWRRPLSAWLALALTVSVAHAEDWLYTVRPGDTLNNICERYVNDEALKHISCWRRLSQIQDIQDPERLQPGQRIAIPVAWLKLQPASARVIAVTGAAFMRDTDQEDRQALVPDTELQAGAVVITEAGANVTIEFADGSRLLLQENSHVVLDGLSAYGDTGMVDTRVRLQRGRVDTQVKPRRGPGSRYEIHTPAAVTAVRGTDFRVAADATRAVGLNEVVGGSVGVTAGGVAQFLPSGFGSKTEVGKPPAPPRELLPPPALTASDTPIDRLPLILQWPALKDAVSYRLQVAAESGFSALLRDAVVADAAAPLGELADGEYFVRVRGIDADGLEGLNSQQRVRIDARPEPPALLSPSANGIVYTPQPVLQWALPETAQGFRLQLARASGEALLDKRTPRAESHAIDIALAPDRYHWRVATIDAEGETGPFSDVQEFTVKPVPASPALETPDASETELGFRWRGDAISARYEFQLAADSEFSQMITDVVVTETQVNVPCPPSGRYYVRVRGIDTDGYRGPYGAVQQVTVPPKSYWPLSILLLPLLL